MSIYEMPVDIMSANIMSVDTVSGGQVSEQN